MSSDRSSSLAAPVDVFEIEQTYYVHVLLPGIAPEEIELTVQGNTLTFRGHFRPSVNPEQQVTWLTQEIGSGSFERSITFPKPIDSENIATQSSNGLLMITVPLHESNRPKRIWVTASEPKPVAVEAEKRYLLLRLWHDGPHPHATDTFVSGRPFCIGGKTRRRSGYPC